MKYLYIFMICIYSLTAYAQADIKLVELADEMYSFGDVKDALDIYKQAIEINPKNIKANYMAGRCYIETIHKERSLPYFLKAYELDPKVAPNILYLIGKAYHLGYKFDEAIDYYTRYKKYLSDKKNLISDSKSRKAEIETADKRLEECKNGKALIKAELNIKIENLGPEINSEYAEYGPLINANETVLYFTSRRRGSTGGSKDKDNEFFEDVYVSNFKNGKWTEPQNLGPEVNTVLHESGIGLSPDGKKLFLYIDNDDHKSDIFVCDVSADGRASKPKSLSYVINTEFIENSITVTADGKTLFFSSNKPGGIGGLDIYMSKLKKNGEWETPVNLGYEINTPFDEEGPFIAADGKTLYFSSKGHKGMGGYDLFRSVYDSTKNQWSKPENLGYPINSTDDDIYFTLSGDGKYGYYASVKNDGYGNLDIYRIRMHNETEQNEHTLSIKEAKKETTKEPTPAPVEPTINKRAPVELVLEVFKQGTKETLNAKVEIADKKSGTILHTGTLANGRLNFTFKETDPRQCVITAEREGYIFNSINVTVPEPTMEKQQVVRMMYLEPATTGKKTVLRNIYFDFNKATLTKESDPELNKLLTMLNSSPAMKIRIDGHTDSIGSAAYNKELSKNRAEAVIRWLIKNGIEEGRLQFKGFGEEMPIASNDDEEDGRELNRRIEFVILSQ